MDPEELDTASREVGAMIPRIARGLATVIDRIFPSDLEVDLRSDRLGLSGRLDRLVTDGHVPSIIKTGFAPDDGVWKKDRLQLAGYAMLTEERYGGRIELGQVEIRDLE